MPWLQQNQLAIVFLLLATVPLQFVLRRNQNTDDAAQRGVGFSVRRLVRGWHDWYTQWEEWFDEVLPPSEDAVDFFEDEDYEYEDEAEVEPMRFQLDLGDGLFLNESNEWFAASKKPRRKRPKNLRYKVGQIVFHTFSSTHCAIVGWDKEMKAPDLWVQLAYGEDAFEDEELIEQPHYIMICDVLEAENLEDEFQYSPQDEVESVAEVKKIVSSHIEHFFEAFDGRRYRMRPWLRKIYPRDNDD